MAKNMTRKSLAVGVAAAFVASGISALPAVAAETLGLDPSAGSGYTTLSGSTFTLSTTLPSNVSAAAAASLKYRVVNDALEDMNIDMESGNGSTDNIKATAYGTATNTQNGGAGANLSGIGDGTGEGDFIVQPDDLTGNSKGALGVTNTLTLTNATANEEFSVAVTAWLDLNGNNVIDGAEDQSPSRTVTFEQPEDATGSVALVTPLAGDATLKARVTFSDSDINVRQIDAGDVLVQFGTVSSGTFTQISSFSDDVDGARAPDTQTVSVTATDVPTSNREGNDVVWNSTDAVYEAVFTPFDTVSGTAGSQALSVSAAETYGAKLFIDNSKDGDTDVDDSNEQEGSTATSTVGADATNYSLEWKLLPTANAINTQLGQEDTGTYSATGYTNNRALEAEIRATALAASDATFQVFVGTDVTTPVGIKDVPVEFTVRNGTGLTVSDGVTVNGLSVHSLQSRTIAATTNASGFATLEIVGGSADANDRLEIDLNVNGQDPDNSSTNDSVSAEIEWELADFDINVKNDLSGNGGLSIVSGETYSVSYDVVDQFGQAPANNLYRVIAQDKASTNEERTTAADYAYAAPVVDGVATVSITDNGVGAGSYTLRSGWNTVGGAIQSGNSDEVDLTINVVSDATPATIDLDDLVYGTEQLEDANGDGDYSDAGDTDNRTELVLETESIYTYITNLASGGETAPELTSELDVTIAGTVENAAGTAIPYAEVTLAAPKFLFVTNSNYVMNEITTIADADGDFSVDVYSQSAGVNNISITAAGASETVTLTYAGATSGAADDFTVTTPGASEPGKTVDVTVDVTDVNGNAVEGATMTLSSTGPGYLINTSGTTLSDGSFTTKLLLGANDSGTATVKVAMTIDGDEVIKTASVVVGVNAVADADKKVNAGSFKGYVAVYAKGYQGQRLSAKIGNDWVIVESLASNFERVVDFTGAGVDIAVRIYIDRVLTDTINLTTK